MKKNKIFKNNKYGLNLIYIPNFLEKTESKKYFEALENSIEYLSSNESQIKIFGKKINIPRKHVGYGDDGLSYKFSGINVKAKKWTDDLLQLKTKIEDYLIKNYNNIFDDKINFVLINRYNDGDDYIGYHKDDEKDLGKKPLIISLSLGATRKFYLKLDDKYNKNINNTDNNDSTIKLELENGSLLLMAHPTNKYWKHSIPKETKIKTPRINLTFRFINNK